ncbi:MAG: twin-arginine translocase TatA/TatE family subunit [Anaerolineaceae bacterium]|nr:twin-arginine translocase TatA/TatE family subunit [Anaerolineaceae bacterium]MCY3936517.1 twin-arginine translocase TatA/TatE family subunit [Chloroflexota bacterium]MCY4009251.1 twin-arginine translocase TatA/TatE family subunit [Anaerolineaceae bacterium]MCY4106409.1 twin-arginine translocase TatA/TatE family subunit [Chloroflexota bacterium]
MPNIGPTELLLFLAIVLLLFGAGRIARVGGEMGEAVSSFRRGLRKGEEEEANSGAQDSA